jgi:hypothetical protein
MQHPLAQDAEMVREVLRRGFKQGEFCGGTVAEAAG